MMAHEVFMKWNAPSRTGVYVGFSDRCAYERIALSSDRDKVVRMAKEGEIIEKPADIIITDSGIPDTLREKIEDAGVQIIIAD